MPSITCRHGGQQHTHYSVLEVKQCQGVVAAYIDRSHYTASDRLTSNPFGEVDVAQARIDDIAQDRAFDAEIQRREREEDEAVARYKADRDYTPVTRYSEQAERQARPQSNPKADKPGIYLMDGQYYKVQAARESGRLYAKVGVQTHAERKWVWQYAKGAIYNIKASHLITPEQASEFGKLWSVCVNCLANLTHEESMERGYGPVCADNHGWPYDHNRKG